MKEFVYGTDQQYELLEESLNDHLCHVYDPCVFPASFSNSTGRIGFEKENDTYALFVDKGITCSQNNTSQLFRDWLAVGTLRFLDFADMKEFLRSLRWLYE
jgi:hypothetical protein